VVDGGTEQLSRALHSLHGAAITVDDMALRPPHLDEAFLELTGQPRPDAADGQVAAGSTPGSQESIKA
jgi:hypothetical protein